MLKNKQKIVLRVCPPFGKKKKIKLKNQNQSRKINLPKRVLFQELKVLELCSYSPASVVRERVAILGVVRHETVHQTSQQEAMVTVQLEAEKRARCQLLLQFKPDQLLACARVRPALLPRKQHRQQLLSLAAPVCVQAGVSCLIQVAKRLS